MESEFCIHNRKSTRLKYFDYNSAGAYFITICTQNRRCILSEIVGTGVLDCPYAELTKYGEIADKYIKQISNFYEYLSVESYVIMPNHIHLLLIIKDTECVNKEIGQSGTPVPTNVKRANSILSQFVSTFKRFCNKEYGENIWQSRTYDHIVRDSEDYEAYMRYIYENPIRWYCDELCTENQYGNTERSVL